jgi:hypothetical protein
MTGELLTRLSECNRRIKQLRQENYQLRLSRDAWRLKHRGCMWENQQLRRGIKRLREQRDKWKWGGRRPYQHPPEWKNIHLSPADLERIMGMKPR